MYSETGRKTKKAGILALINYTREKQLTPKKKILYKELQVIKKRLMSAQNSRVRRRLQFAEARAKTSVFRNLESLMDPIVANFFKCQLRNASKTPQGRRFTTNDKIMSLALLKESGKSYKRLAKMFILPSKRTLTNLLNKIPLNAGLNDALFANIKTTVNKMKDKQKYRVLAFDEMSLQRLLEWDIKRDMVVGVEDTGNTRTGKIANHALVFLIRGLFGNWKQPIMYTFCEATTKTLVLTYLIKMIISKIHDSGLRVLVTVCDQGKSNVASINILINESRAMYAQEGRALADNYFEVNGHQVIPVYDIPHLMKGVRNNLLNYNLVYKNESNVNCFAKWDHIVRAYEIDAPAGKLRLLHKITDYHVVPLKIKKMKVSCCTQVFSHQVASTILRRSLDNASTSDKTLIMPAEAVETANLLKFFDELFDSVNGNTHRAPPGQNISVLVQKHLGIFTFGHNLLKR